MPVCMLGHALEAAGGSCVPVLPHCEQILLLCTAAEQVHTNSLVRPPRSYGAAILRDSLAAHLEHKDEGDGQRACAGLIRGEEEGVGADIHGVCLAVFQRNPRKASQPRACGQICSSRSEPAVAHQPRNGEGQKN
jgi:hypothetical protein